MTDRTQALAEAKKIGRSVKFEEFDDDGNLIFCGTARSCGCLEFTTVLSDGSLGWGGWDEECGECFFSH